MNRNRQAKKICTVGLTTALALGVGVSAFTFTNANTRPNQTFTSTGTTALTGNKVEKKAASSDLFKDEAVYALADPSGAINDITVADWLKNAGGSGSITDNSSLSDIVNTKGDETFSQDGNILTWEAGKEDIYYQGKSSEELPVEVAFTYKLDGQEITPADLAGKSGSLEMQIKYTNKSLQKTKVDGKVKELYTPFTMATALLLPNETFANVQVDNGKIVSDGDKLVVVGYGMPGVSESLELSDDINLTIPDTVTITADVTDFEMGSTLTYASSDLLSDFNVDDIYDVDSLKEKLDDLKDASRKLVDGTKELKDGVKELKDKTGDFTDGINTLVDGLEEFSKGIGTLKTGVTDYTDGVNTLVNGVNTYVNGASTLSDGVTAYTKGTDQLVAGVNTLSTSLTELPGNLKKLSDGYSLLMNGVSQLASKENMTALSNGTASLSAGITSVHDGIASVQGGVSTINKSLSDLEASYANNEKCIQALKASLAGVTDPTAKATLQTVIGQLEQVTAAQKQGIKALKENTAGTSKLGQGLAALESNTGKNGALKQGAVKLNTAVSQFAGGAAQIQEKLPQLQAGTNKLAGAVEKLPGALKQLVSGANKLGKNSVALRSGAAKLKTGGKDLTAGGKKLTSNNQALLSGINKLNDASGKLITGGGKLSDGAVKLTDGVGKLYDGSVKLNDGMVKFDKDGITKLYNTVDEDLKGLLDRLKAMKELGDNYQSFSGKSDSMNGSVKFIIKTDEIKTDKNDSADNKNN